MKHPPLFFLFCIIFLCTSCKPSEDNTSMAKKEFHVIVRPYIEEMIKGEIPNVIINNIEILRVDTTTEKSDSLLALYLLQEKQEIQSQISEAQHKLAKTTLELANSMEYIDNSAYVRYRNDAKRELEKSVEESMLVTKIIDRILSIDSLSKTNKLDSIKPTGYFVFLNVKATDNLNVIQDIDSIGIYLDLDKRIKEKSEMMKNL